MEIPLTIQKKTPDFLRLGQILLVLYILIFHPILTIQPQIFLPLIPVFDHLYGVDFIERLLHIILIISVLCVVINYQSRFFIGLLGFGIILVILADRTRFANSLTYSACLMILCALYQKKFHWIFRVQISLLYFGAGLNKILDPDWLNGQYFENFALEIFHIPFYENLARLFPDLFLSIICSWMTIFFELFFAMVFLFKISIYEVICIAYLFHGIMLVLTQGKLSVLFFYLMGISFLLSIEYPKDTIKVNYTRKILPLVSIFKTIDWDYSFKWSEDNLKTLSLSIQNKRYKGISAWIRLLLLHKYLHFWGLLLFALLRLIIFIT